MPVQRCTAKGRPGWKWGSSGKCYTGRDAKAKAARQGRAILSTGWTENASKRRVSPRKVDPSRTKGLRDQFERDLRKRLLELKRSIVRLVAEEDAFGLRTVRNQAENQRFRFNTAAEKVEAYNAWLREQYAELLLNEAEDKYWEQYIADAYSRGQGRAFDDTRVARRAEAYGSDQKMAFYQGSREEFLRSAFGQTESIDKVKLLAGRTLTDLKGVTEAMATSMSRVLVDGLAKGDNPWTVARQLNKTVDTIGKNRSLTIARTEIIRAHAEGQLDALERLGVERVGVMVEWSTAGDDRVCPECQPLEGVVMTLTEARGTIPRHPNCLPGDCLVSSSSGIAAASERWFDGDMIVIRTTSGRELSCTPNHPVLTNRGWVAAQDIDLGCQVVCDGSIEWKRWIDGDNQDVPPVIHDVVKSFFNSGKVSTSPVPLSSVDFHGDGMDGQIAVVGTNGSLLCKYNTSLVHRSLDPKFYGGDIVGSFFDRLGVHDLRLETLMSSSDGVVGSRSLPGSFLRSHFGPLEQLRFGLVTHHDTGVNQSTLDDPAADLEFLRKLVARLPRNVFLDDVIYVDRYPVSCHVYNLQTGYGWYTANGIITHNCRCAYVPAQVGEDRDTTRRVNYGDEGPHEVGQKRSPEEVRRAFKESISKERKKGTFAEKKAKSTWAGADKHIADKRPTSPLYREPGKFTTRKVSPTEVRRAAVTVKKVVKAAAKDIFNDPARVAARLRGEEEAVKLAKSLSRRQAKTTPVPKTVKRLAKEYSEDLAFEVNEELRRGKSLHQVGRMFDANLELLQKASQQPLPEEVITFRGMGVNSSKAVFPNGVKIGEEVKFTGFTSTSLERKTAQVFATSGDDTGLVLEIRTNHGYVVPASYDYEAEILLPHGEKYKVVGMYEEEAKIGSKVLNFKHVMLETVI